MWTKILESAYFLSFTNKIEIFVTDFITLWTCSLTEESFLKCLKESNFALNLKDIDFINRGKALLSKCNELKKASIMPDVEAKKLNLYLTMSCGYLFHLKIKLDEGSKELFFYKITQNLLKTVNNLRESERKLRQHLIKKDKEIEEYKCEGGEIALRHLKTIPFDDDAHMATHKVYEDLLGSADVPSDLLLKTSPSDINDLCDIKPSIKEEPLSIINGIKTEPDSQSTASESTFGLPYVKSESSSSSVSIKNESISDATSGIVSIKKELNSESTSNIELNSNLTSVIQTKVETVKTESDTNLIKVSPRKRLKTKLNI